MEMIAWLIERATVGIESLAVVIILFAMANGTIIVACNLALTAWAGRLAEKEKLPRDQARKELFAAVIPGVYVVPNGVFGVCAAQEAGCGYIAVR